VADAKQALEALSRGAAPAQAAELGDRSLLQQDFADLDEQAVASQFGAEFARAICTLEPGRWRGPLESGYGLHLVRVAEVRQPRQRSFAEVSAQVLEQWRSEKQKGADEAYFAGLLEKYDVVVDESVKPLLGPALVAKGRER
jgi:parvulin-like peptidyl-prolyl isomerase